MIVIDVRLISKPHSRRKYWRNIGSHKYICATQQRGTNGKTYVAEKPTATRRYNTLLQWNLYKTTTKIYGFSRQVVFHDRGNEHDFV